MRSRIGSTHKGSCKQIVGNSGQDVCIYRPPRYMPHKELTRHIQALSPALLLKVEDSLGIYTNACMDICMDMFTSHLVTMLYLTP